MRKNESENTNDIISEIRNRTGDMYDGFITMHEDEFHSYADRFEDAVWRERWNVAQMRNALKKIVSLTNSLDENCAVDPVEIRDIARNALSESSVG